MTTIDTKNQAPVLPAPPEVSARAARLARRLMTPVESFLHVEASSGVVLLAVAAIALFLANSRFAGAYHHVLELPLGIRASGFSFEKPVHFWVNDGLMTIFFFVVGLEIRREIHEGELSTLRRAALPAAAALGGMIAPASLYLLVAGWRPENRAGWGIPMATDIAFAVGVLALLGKRVPAALRVLLLALAIIDDIGSILVIAVFYSGPIDLTGVVTAAGGVVAIVAMQRLGIRRPALYVVPGLVVWVGALRSGIHPTIAGVAVGLLTPARSWLGAEGLVDVALGSARLVERGLAEGTPGQIEAHELARAAAALDLARREALSPAARLQIALHPWVAFAIMPIFAFANAGVTIGDAFHVTQLTAGVVLGLVVGKPLGVLVACAIALRIGVASAPRGIGVRQLVVLGVTSGIGFTMALFIGALAFPAGARLEEAKLAVLVASAVALVAGLATGRLLLPVAAEGAGGAAATPSEAELHDEK